jgi:hypothetical protein
MWTTKTVYPPPKSVKIKKTPIVLFGPVKENARIVFATCSNYVPRLVVFAKIIQ